MALKWIHNKEIPGFQAVGFILVLKKETAVQKKAELKILMDMGGAVKHIYKKKLKVHLAVGYDFKLLVHGISSLSDSIRLRGRACKVKSKFVMV